MNIILGLFFVVFYSSGVFVYYPIVTCFDSNLLQLFLSQFLYMLTNMYQTTGK